MKKCLCKAIVKDDNARHMLCTDIESLGGAPLVIGLEVSVEFKEHSLLEPMIALFDQFDAHSVFVEF